MAASARTTETPPAAFPWKRRAGIVCLGMVACLLAAALWNLAQPTRYRASTRLILRAEAMLAPHIDLRVHMQEMRRLSCDLVISPIVEGRALERLGEPPALAAQYQASCALPQQNNALILQVAGPDAAQVVRINTAMGRVGVSYLNADSDLARYLDNTLVVDETPSTEHTLLFAAVFGAVISASVLAVVGLLAGPRRALFAPQEAA